MMNRAQTAITDQYVVALERRKNGGGEKSYTSYLYNQGLDKILKKCGEETFEVCIAAKNDDQVETVGELNDVLYHVTVLLCFSGVTLEMVMADLNRRCQTEGQSFDALMRVIEARRDSDDAESYTAYLFREGLDKILKKVGEECAETIIAAKNGDKAELVGEINDVFYHMMVMMNECGVTMEDVCREMDIRAQKIGNLKKFHVSDHNS